MKRSLRFFKQDNKWYADLPNHSLEDNEMVMGADLALEFLSEGKDEVTLTIADECPEDNAVITLTLKEHDEEGGYYTVDGMTIAESGHEVWVCNVTHDVFGEHPENIYLLGID